MPPTIQTPTRTARGQAADVRTELEELLPLTRRGNGRGQVAGGDRPGERS